MFNGEKWIDIKGYENEYSISSCGRVYSIKNDLIMKLRKKDSGYITIKLTKNGKSKYFLVHRLVAENFLQNENNKTQVNHINKIKDDNRLVNLEWVTPSENTKHFQKEIKFGTNINRCFNIDDLENEIWKTIPGYEKYQISNLGRIKSYNFTNRINKPIIIKTRIFGGYESVTLYGKSISVHKLVAITFIPNYDKTKNILNHINENKFDNRVENLELVTPSENTKLFIENNKHKIKRGNSCSYSKLNEDNVKDIFYDEESTYSEISIKHGISIQTVCDIKKKRSWKHITNYL